MLYTLTYVTIVKGINIIDLKATCTLVHYFSLNCHLDLLSIFLLSRVSLSLSLPQEFLRSLEIKLLTVIDTAVIFS